MPSMVYYMDGEIKMKKPSKEELEKRTVEDWVVILRQKTAGNLVVGILLGVAFTLAVFAAAYIL